MKAIPFPLTPIMVVDILDVGVDEQDEKGKKKEAA